MAELNNREKKIIMIKYIVHGTSPFDSTPLEQRVQMLEASLKTMGIEYDESELLDLGQAILNVQQNANDSALGFLKSNPSLVKKAISMIGKGNDRLGFADTHK